MKKISVALIAILVSAFLITISYASFVVENATNLNQTVSVSTINTGDTTKTLSFIDTSDGSITAKGLSYYQNTTNSSKEVIKEDAKIEISFKILRHQYQAYVQKFGEKNKFYFNLDIKSNSNLASLSPIAYIKYSNKNNDYIAYFDVSYSDNKYVGGMPISLQTVFSNDYLNYVVNKSSTDLTVTLVIDFSKTIDEGITLNTTDSMSIVFGVKEVA